MRCALISGVENDALCPHFEGPNWRFHCQLHPKCGHDLLTSKISIIIVGPMTNSVHTPSIGSSVISGGMGI